MFEEKEIYIDTLLEYNQKYCDRYCNSERPYSCKVVIKDVPFMEFDIAQLCKTEEKRNLVNTIKNLQELKVFFINTKKPSRAEFDKIETYLLTIQRYKQTRLYAGLNLSPKKELKLNKLIGGYSLLLGLIRKSYFKKEFLVSDELREKCFVKIDEMIILEKELNESGEKN